MPGRKTIYSRHGYPLTDIRASVVRSWLLKDIGQASFSVITDSPKCRLEYLEYGNYVVFQHDKLPAWVGMIDPPRSWGNGYVTVNAYEPAILLKYRYPAVNLKFTGTPGEKLAMLINAANEFEDTLIEIGENISGGEATDEEFSDSVYAHINDLCGRYAIDWKTYPVIGSDRKLKIKMDFRSTVGVDTGVELTQGRHIMYGDTPLEESGELINSFQALLSTNDNQNTYAEFTSPMPYGLRMGRSSYSGELDSADLLAIAQSMVSKSKDPVISAPLTVVDSGNVFYHLDIGNRMKYSFRKVGFGNAGVGTSRNIRIAGMRFDESIGTCELFTENV